MSLFKWWDERKRRRDRAAFEDGFGWAMTEFYLNKKSSQQILAYPACSQFFESARHPFDNGVITAVGYFFKELQ